MGLRYRKSFKVAPGVRVNLSKKGVGMSVGTKGARYSVSSTGRRTTTVGVPGTGLSYSKSRSGKKSTKKATTTQVPARDQTPRKRKSYGVTLLVIAAVCILLGLPTVGSGGWVFLLIGVPCLLLGVASIKKYKTAKDTAKPEE